jgi:hypothetical protein
MPTELGKVLQKMIECDLRPLETMSRRPQSRTLMGELKLVKTKQKT